jgi:malyl-CoA/(S)-citramalyl-CoA lyase
MSLTTHKPRRFRLQRSELAVPATSPHFFEKAARGDADVIFLDLEDAVAPEQKVNARSNAIAALKEVDWGKKTVAVRVNGLDTPWAYRDICEIAERCPRLDMFMLPKAGTAFDVQFVDALLGQIERDTGRAEPFGLEVLIETALGMSNVEQIAASCERLEAMIFGVGDYSISMQTGDVMFGSASPTNGISPWREWRMRAAPMGCGRSMGLTWTMPTRTDTGPAPSGRQSWAWRGSGRFIPTRLRLQTKSIHRIPSRLNGPAGS